MDKHQIAAALKEIENLAEFSRKYQVPLRTLERARTGMAPLRATTLMVISMALNRHRVKAAKKVSTP